MNDRGGRARDRRRGGLGWFEMVDSVIDDRHGSDGGRSGRADGFRAPAVQGRFVVLRPVGPEDYRLLRAAELGGELGVRWRYRGATVSPEQWAQGLWQGTLVQYLVVGTGSPAPIGLVAAYQANFQDGFGYVAAESFRAHRSSPLMMFGLFLFLEYVFTCWDFHKLYFEVAEYNVGQFGSGIGRLLAQEGRLREHFWFAGRRWDQFVLALYRERWREESGRLLAAVHGPGELRARVRMPAKREQS